MFDEPIIVTSFMVCSMTIYLHKELESYEPFDNIKELWKIFRHQVQKDFLNKWESLDLELYLTQVPKPIFSLG